MCHSLKRVVLLSVSFLTHFGQQLFKMERSPLFIINTILVENMWSAIIWWIIDPWKLKNTPYVFHLLHCAHGNKCPRPCVMLMHLLSTNLTFFMVQEQLYEFLSTLLHSSHWLVDIICSKYDVCTFLNAIIVNQHANGCFFNLDLPKILDYVSFTSKGNELPRWTSNKSKSSFKNRNIWLLA
jgi:hypothetical protein